MSVYEQILLGGGSVATACLLFKHFGKKWIENKFAQNLAEFKHQQALEIQRLHIEIESLLSGAIKFQEKEFQILPEAWQKLDEARVLVEQLVLPLQEYPPVDHMQPPQLEEFLATCRFTESQKNDIRNSHDKSEKYKEIAFRYQLFDAETAIADFRDFVARNGIFLPPELKEKFSNISKLLWSAVVSKEVGHEAQDRKMQLEGWTIVQEKLQPIYTAIEADIQARLWSHGHKS